jgi:hypothetical protein
MAEYQSFVVETQGKDEYDKYIHGIKQRIFGEKNVEPLRKDSCQRTPKYVQLRKMTSKWEGIMLHLNPEGQIVCHDQLITHWYYMASKA